MQKFSKIILGVALSGVLVGIPVSYQYQHTEQVQFKSAQKTNQQLKQKLIDLQHTHQAQTQKIKEKGQDDAIQKLGNQIGNAEITIAKGTNDTAFKQTKPYLDALQTITSNISNDAAWKPANTPWINDPNLKCHFMLGNLTDHGQRQVAWVFVDDKSQPVSTVTGLWDDSKGSFTSLAEYSSQIQGVGDNGVKPVMKNNTVSSTNQSSSSQSEVSHS